MYEAKIDFTFRRKPYKKGDEVRVSDSLAGKLESEGKISLKKTTKKPKDS